MDELPAAVEWLARQLLSRGFTRQSDDTNPEFFGNRLVVFRREPIEIRLVKDRGQWTCDLIADGWALADRVTFPLFKGFGLSE
jgi:hypothetical protein